MAFRRSRTGSRTGSRTWRGQAQIGSARAPIVLTHARALLTSGPAGRTAYVGADLRDADEVLSAPDVRATLDLARLVALLLIAIMHFIPDAGQAPPTVTWPERLRRGGPLDRQAGRGSARQAPSGGRSAACRRDPPLLRAPPTVLTHDLEMHDRVARKAPSSLVSSSATSDARGAANPSVPARGCNGLCGCSVRPWTFPEVWEVNHIR